MRFTIKFHSILYLLAFVYLVMCPSVHQLSDIVRHDFTPQVGKLLQHKSFKKGFNLNPFKFHNNNPLEDFAQLKTSKEIKFSLSFLSTAKLSSLSTVRLILWLAPFSSPFIVRYFQLRIFLFLISIEMTFEQV